MSKKQYHHYSNYQHIHLQVKKLFAKLSQAQILVEEQPFEQSTLY